MVTRFSSYGLVAAQDSLIVDVVMGIQADALSNVLQRNTELQSEITRLKAQRSKYSGW